MGWLRKWIISLILKEIEVSGFVIGNYRIYNKNGAITISEVKDGE